MSSRWVDWTKNSNKACFVDSGVVRAHVTSPLVYYVCSDSIAGNLGGILYGADGATIEVVLEKAKSGGGMDGNQTALVLSLGSRGPGNSAIVRPINELLDLIKQGPPEKNS